MQANLHDPVMVIRRIKKFTWSMAKLILIFEEAEDNDNIMTNFKKFINSITVDEEGKHIHQNVKLNRKKTLFAQELKQRLVIF